DDKERIIIFERLLQIGLLIEESFEQPQDIEGVFSSDDKCFVVQTRPL
ncbi:Pyruvate phosphate dikinase, PEP/pyruvate-binding domain protein, partial [Candidatus Magnetoovum chiemensis]